jgi:hypothetical protein
LCILLYVLVVPAAALEAFGQALTLHRQKQQAALDRNAAREKKRAAVAAAGDDALAAQLEGSIEEDEPVPVVPAKLLNNTAVLKYRWAGWQQHLVYRLTPW